MSETKSPYIINDSTESDNDVPYTPPDLDLGDPFIDTDNGEHYKLDTEFIKLPLRLKRFLMAYAEWHAEVVR
jgi:hypothetical protein